MTPEEKARQKIDRWFADAGWKVVNRDDYEPTCTAVAIREGLLKGNLEADYFLFINGKAVGYLKQNEKKQTLLRSKFATKQLYMQEVSPISIRCIKSHCLLYLPQMVRNYIAVISVNKILVSSR